MDALFDSYVISNYIANNHPAMHSFCMSVPPQIGKEKKKLTISETGIFIAELCKV